MWGNDHVHLFVSVPPYLSVRMQYLKGKSSHKLLMGSRICVGNFGQAFVGQGLLGSEHQ